MTAITGAGTTLFSASSLFDKLDRLSTRTLTGGAYTQTTAYAYEWGTTLPQSVTVNGSTVSYTYDAAGNITTITDGSLVTYYTYDSLNQLVREDNAYSNKTVVYTYDNGGNLLTKTEYPYSPTVADITTLTPTNTVTYTYGNADWKDQLTSFNGEAITYDAIGNPLTYRGMTLTWQNGRQLATLSKEGLNVSYGYNDEGLRTQKTVNGVTTEYYWNGSQLLGQKTGSSLLHFLYDERGMLVGFNDGTKTYLYTRNLQGDIIAITDTATETVVATYTYDSWGNVLTATGTMANINPFRYRGYYFDTETGLYYLQSRYYDAEVGRFINADAYVSTGQGMIGNNMYAYCGNGPVNRIDITGAFFKEIGDWFSDAWDWTKQAATDAWDWTKQAATDAWDWTKQAATDAWDWTKQAATDAWDWTKQAATDAWDWTKQAATDAWDWTKQAATDAWDWTAQAATDAWNWTTSKVSAVDWSRVGKQTAITAASAAIGGAVTGALSGALGAPFTAGLSILGCAGIGALIGLAGGAVEGFMQSFLEEIFK